MSDDVAVTLDADTEPEDAVDDGAATDRRRGLRRRGAQISIVVGIVALVAVPVGIELTVPDRAVSDAVESDVVRAATEGTVAVLSYRADSVQSDVDGAKARLTGDFLTYYSGFAEQSVVPGAIERGLTSSTVVSGAALVSMDDAEAVALLFVNQTVTAADSPDPRATSTSLRVEMAQVDGRWLVSALDPVR
ncbi:hypothetical protein [Rhodococcus sp. MEB064]|uniref:hypothetical protein n=1 Tax=Rhodococcus sp. MEB064 TaxID=1587522 RepID=UPI0006966F6F|nr:hypothetical protein [Rhodococcus sp. MEB064]